MEVRGQCRHSSSGDDTYAWNCALYERRQTACTTHVRFTGDRRPLRRRTPSRARSRDDDTSLHRCGVQLRRRRKRGNGRKRGSLAGAGNASRRTRSDVARARQIRPYIIEKCCSSHSSYSLPNNVDADACNPAQHSRKHTAMTRSRSSDVDTSLHRVGA
ncbi:hypothetical protein SCHPADRAFT_165335 [Schizopora paradoxa]|uniref:Uncharacterized protein n=1 Tax=Schizopora paradoxa TaxID=27342 RepID=A0A0H2S0Z0_9AGAM|nr:hypothetical protein SCHPADRAFT_165335 [Schizopora paradoxa]